VTNLESSGEIVEHVSQPHHNLGVNVELPRAG
jgi:hypothetical protein